jgi:uncharacterized protein (TIGR02145 family)
MASNLNVDKFRNGDPIPQAKTDAEWIEAAKNRKPAWCYFDNDTTNGRKFGKLYNWYAVNDSRKIAPVGWHVATDEDFNTMKSLLGSGVSGKKMKSTIGWKEGANGTNESGFNGLPGGYRVWTEFGNGLDGSFDLIGDIGIFWTATEYDNIFSWYRSLLSSNDNVFRTYTPKGSGHSIRCVKD